MYTEERQNKILAILEEKRSVSVNELTGVLNFSPATIRTDLNYLSDQGLLVRTHGGATLLEKQKNDQIERSYDIRERKNNSEKKEIAKYAIEYVHPRECIILDASSTCYELAKLLLNTTMQLTVLTSGLRTAELLKNNPNITLIVIGGIVKASSNAIEGLLGAEILTKLNIDRLFVSSHSFNLKDGLADFNLYEVELKRKMVEYAPEVFALVDHSKLEKKSIATFANPQQISTLITNRKADNSLVESYIKEGLNVIVAK